MTTKKLRVVFLDVDGVLNCATTSERYKGVIGFEPVFMRRLNRILSKTGCKVVVSSSWRNMPDIEAILKEHGLEGEVIGRTPYCKSGFRGDEIKAWLESHPAKVDYICLDDDADFYANQNLYQTSWKKGLQPDMVNRIIKHFT